MGFTPVLPSLSLSLLLSLSYSHTTYLSQPGKKVKDGEGKKKKKWGGEIAEMLEREGGK